MSPTPPPTAGLQRAPLDVYKKITVIREKEDSVSYEDSQGRLQQIKDLGEESLSATPSLQPKVKLDIPVPTITDVSNYERDVPATYQIPRSYVRYHRPPMEEVETSVEYNVDEDDEAWLASHKQFGTRSNMETANISEPEIESEGSEQDGEPSDNMARIGLKKPSLSLNIFEQMIDILEKATGLETIITLAQAENIILAKIPALLQIFGTSHAGPNHKEQKRQKNETTVRVVISEVYNYWVNKRSKLKKPLLRKYWPVTASNDTNPHMVFRPREKEKYKLRKKRQNDLDAYKKMKQLKIDFTKVRVLLELIQKRENLTLCMLEMQCDWFDQRVYEMIDTSAIPRESDRLTQREIEKTLEIPKHFDTFTMDRNKKKKRKRSSSTKPGKISPAPVGATIAPNSEQNQMSATNAAPNLPKRIAADQSNPPTFLDSLQTRTTYTTSWENAVPFITTYANSKPIPTSRFRHRPRIGRGGRVIIDRIPCPGHPEDPPINVFTAGQGVRVKAGESRSMTRILDLLPEPLDTDHIRRRIEEISAAALNDDKERTIKSRAPTLPSAPSNVALADDATNTEEILVKLNAWIDTDEQKFGTEVGPPIGPI